jgi:cation:H+ antiporter
LQTLPEFAVEAVIAWKQQTPWLLANLTGALRLLTGLGWPLIYFSAAFVHRRRTGRPLGCIRLDQEHSINIAALLASLFWMAIVLAKGTLTLLDAAILVGIYAAYLTLLGRMPASGEEGIDDLETIPRAIVLSPRRRRILLITACFAAGGVLIWFVADPFLGSLLAVAALLGIPGFISIQWFAPVISEAPEMVSTFYFARTVTRAPMALMNMVSSNINQWTLLVAMLPLVYSLSRGSISSIPFDRQQQLELLMTIGQALLGALFLVNMELAWREALTLFLLWALQLGFSAAPANAAGRMNVAVTVAYFSLAGWELLRIVTGRRRATAVFEFQRIWRLYVLKREP